MAGEHFEGYDAIVNRMCQPQSVELPTEIQSAMTKYKEKEEQKLKKEQHARKV